MRVIVPICQIAVTHRRFHGLMVETTRPLKINRIYTTHDVMSEYHFITEAQNTEINDTLLVFLTSAFFWTAKILVLLLLLSKEGHLLLVTPDLLLFLETKQGFFTLEFGVGFQSKRDSGRSPKHTQLLILLRFSRSKVWEFLISRS